MKKLSEFDLSLGFYFSNSYDLTNPLSKNITKNLKNTECRLKQSFEKTLSREFSKSFDCHQISFLENYSDFFAWNHNLISDFSKIIVNKRWIMPIIHGYLEQKSILIFNFGVIIEKKYIKKKNFIIIRTSSQ